MSRKLSIPLNDEPEDLIKRYEQFLSGNGSGYFDVEELGNIVDYYLRHGSTKESTRALELGFQLHPRSSELKIKRAKIYLVAGEGKKAFHILDSLSETGNDELLFLKVEALLKIGLSNDAMHLAYRILDDESEDVDNFALDLAYIFIGQLDFENALEFLKLGDSFYAENLDLLYELAFCYEQTSQYALAMETYDRIIKIDSFSAEAWFNLGQIHFMYLDFQNAIDAYDFALAINQDDLLTCLQKAHAHFQLGDFDEAIESYKEYAKFGIDSWQSNLFIGECYEKLERFDQAIVYYQNSLLEKTDNFEALTGIGICLLEKEQFEDSLIYIYKALELNEHAADAWVYLAEALSGLDDLENALIAYLKSIEIDPDQPDTLMAVANICMDNNEFETALNYYLKAYELDDALEFVELFIAIAFYKTLNFSASKLYLSKALAKSTDSMKLFKEVCPEADVDDLIIVN